MSWRMQLTLRVASALALVMLVCAAVQAADVKKSLVVTFKHEGGLQCDASDPGNWTSGRVGIGRQGCTKYGIATNTYPHEDIRNMKIERAAVLYNRDFFRPLRLHEMESQGLANEIFDTAVNCGVGTSANIVRKTINYLGPAKYPMTGKLNAEQVEWINKYTRKKINRTKFWKILNVYQAERYMAIINSNEKMRKYENSWFSRVGG